VVVLGTSFNVNQRQEKTQVVLAEGKVEVSNTSERKKVMMHPGKHLEYAPHQHSIAKAIVNPEIYSSWQTHHLIFDGVPLAQVAQRLEEIFGYEVICREDVSDFIFKGTVPSDDIQVSLTVIQNAFGIKVTKKDGQIIFSK
jgi:ferric-dicitrate binding protein FerR (iron transport regulator)